MRGDWLVASFASSCRRLFARPSAQGRAYLRHSWQSPMFLLFLLEVRCGGQSPWAQVSVMGIWHIHARWQDQELSLSRGKRNQEGDTEEWTWKGGRKRVRPRRKAGGGAGPGASSRGVKLSDRVPCFLAPSLTPLPGSARLPLPPAPSCSKAYNREGFELASGMRSTSGLGHRPRQCALDSACPLTVSLARAAAKSTHPGYSLTHPLACTVPTGHGTRMP